jgi:hypothetical protein
MVIPQQQSPLEEDRANAVRPDVIQAAISTYVQLTRGVDATQSTRSIHDRFPNEELGRHLDAGMQRAA